MKYLGTYSKAHGGMADIQTDFFVPFIAPN